MRESLRRASVPARRLFITRMLRNASLAVLGLAGGAAVLMGLYSLTLPHTPAPAKGKPFSLRDVLGLDSLAMLKDRNYLIFILACLLICVPLAVYYSYAPVFVNAAGAAATPPSPQCWQARFSRLVTNTKYSAGSTSNCSLRS